MEKRFLKLPLTPDQQSGLEYTNIQTSISRFIHSLINTAPDEFQSDQQFGQNHHIDNQLKHIPELLTALNRYEKRINKISIKLVNIDGYPHLEFHTWITSLNNHYIFQIPLQLNLIK